MQKRAAWWILFVAMASVIQGCSTVRSYPVCLYDTDYGAINETEAAWPSYKTSLESALALETGDRSKVLIVNSREALAETMRSQDKQILKIWPRIACYGRSSGGTSAQELQNCQNYVTSRMLADRNGFSLPDDTITPLCHTVKEH
jgi:hypothetical protein